MQSVRFLVLAGVQSGSSPWSRRMAIMAAGVAVANAILLVTFALLTQSLVTAETKVWLLKPMTVLPFFMLVFLTAFEVLVGFMQAYIFTILTAVYIGGAMHPEH